jgi:predicted HTH transcriptional regulator
METAAQVGVLKALKPEDDFSLNSDDFTDSTPYIIYMLRQLRDAVRTEVEHILNSQLDDRVKRVMEEKVNNNIVEKRKNKLFSTKRQIVDYKRHREVENNLQFEFPSSIRLSKSEQRIVSLLQDDCRLTIGALSQCAQLSEAGVNKVLSSLRHKGVLERVGANKNGCWVVHLD